MVPSYDTVGDWLEEISEEFPDAFFEELDGGIQLSEEALPDPDFPPGEMYIMGEYCHDMLGRYIVLYYGSFRKVFYDASYDELREEIRKTIAHEFRHHWESLSGTRDLEVEDEIELSQYLSNMDEDDEDR